jgi:hypothetical protein
MKSAGFAGHNQREKEKDMGFDYVAKIINAAEKRTYDWGILDRVGRWSQNTVCVFCYNYLFYMDEDKVVHPKEQEPFEKELRGLFFGEQIVELIPENNKYFVDGIKYPKIKTLGPDFFENFVVLFLPSGIASEDYYYGEILGELRENKEIRQMRIRPQYFFSLDGWKDALVMACNSAYPKHLESMAKKLVKV